MHFQPMIGNPCFQDGQIHRVPDQVNRVGCRPDSLRAILTAQQEYPAVADLETQRNGKRPIAERLRGTRP